MQRIRRSAVAWVVASALMLAGPARANEQVATALMPTVPSAASTAYVGFGSSYLVLVSAYAMTALAPFSVTGLVVYLLIKNKEQETGKKIVAGVDDAQAEAMAYLLLWHTSEQLTQDLALGTGPSLDDLAALLLIPRSESPRLGALLHAHADELIPLLNRDALTHARAGRFFARVGELMRQEPALGAHLEALVAQARASVAKPPVLP